MAAKKTEPASPDRNNDELGKTLPPDPIQPLQGPELVFGLVGPIGANLESVNQILSDELENAGYKSEVIKLSSLIRSVKKFETIPISPEDIRIEMHMDAGTQLREVSGRGDILALMSVAAIRNTRQIKGKNKDPKIALPRQAYILSSLKHPDEVAALRSIYGPFFILISAYLPRSKRVDALAKVISKSHKAPYPTKFRDISEKLVSKDEEEEGKPLGQDVSDAFPMADFFVYSHQEKVIRKSISRFIDILFGYPFHTPSIDEMGMFFAQSAGLRSADLARQVGAVITNGKGDIISVGCNEVPKPGGGQYWEEDINDSRDFQLGYDSSTVYKNDILKEVIDKLLELKLFSKELMETGGSDILELFVGDSDGEILRETQIHNLLEFGRPVHAEMAAITSAARTGNPTIGATLYSTTFPCHMCARHIISSGIKRVVYIEPYPKSRVFDLYEDSIAVDESPEVSGRVNFVPFVGVAPSRYQEFFKKISKRKYKNGKKIDWERSKSNPRVSKLEVSTYMIEEKVIQYVGKLLESLNF